MRRPGRRRLVYARYIALALRRFNDHPRSMIYWPVGTVATWRAANAIVDEIIHELMYNFVGFARNPGLAKPVAVGVHSYTFGNKMGVRPVRACVAKCNRCRSGLDVAGTGRPPRFCSAACRQAAYRRRSKRSVHFRSSTCEWPTPPDFFDSVNARFDFTLDVCASAENAKCARFYTRADDGLAQPWTGRVWCNPPYGREIGKWIARAWQAAQSGEAEVVVCLVPARTDTSYWHEYASKADVEFIKGRLRFGDGIGSAPFPSALLVFRNAEHRYETSP